MEAQHLVSTRKLVGSDAEQQLLEELIEERKPPADAERLHYLLFTPFRYPPLPHGSRFGTRGERGIWYGSETPRGAFAETAYYRLLFLDGTRAELAPWMLELSLFRAAFRSPRGIDLTRPPFDAHAAAISSPTRYEVSQRLGRSMRVDGVEVFRYRSARDREGSVNLGILSPRAFAARRPAAPQSWHCVVTREAVELVKKDVFRHETYRFPREDFEVDGELPAPAV